MNRKIIFVEKSREQLIQLSAEQPKLIKRIFELIENIDRTPFEGIGKPEPLKYQLKGKWSRRINEEHRLVYEVNNTEIIIYACKFHYD
jgi:toxin YoeB